MKTGDTVIHNMYGAGKVLEIRRAGLEAKVRFDTGIVLPCFAKELYRAEDRPSEHPAAEQSLAKTETKFDHLPVASPKPSKADSQPDQKPQRATRQISGNGFQKETVDSVSSGVPSEIAFSARQTIEAVRFGVVPQNRINELTVGLAKERSHIRNSLLEVERSGGDAITVVGEYGSGKSHLFEWTAKEALKQNFVVAKISLDIFDVPPNKPHRIYNALIRSLRYPDRTDGGSLAPLFDHFLDDAEYKRLTEKMTIMNKDCILLDAFKSYAKNFRRADAQSASVVLDWISCEKLYATQVRSATQGAFKRMSVSMRAADQYCYLLGGIAWMARQAKYAGLTILLDEAEHYSLLSKTHKTCADSFFKGMMLVALGDRQSKIASCRKDHSLSPDCVLKHGAIHYPYQFADDCALLFMFAVTPSTSALDYPSWIDESKTIHLDNRLSEGEIETLLAQIYVFHRQAYDYDRKEAYMEVGSKLISYYESGRINLRELIRLSTEVFDLLYSHRDYHFDSLIREIDSAFA